MNTPPDATPRADAAPTPRTIATLTEEGILHQMFECMEDAENEENSSGLRIHQRNAAASILRAHVAAEVALETLSLRNALEWERAKNDVARDANAALVAERDALAAQVAALREALATAQFDIYHHCLQGVLLSDIHKGAQQIAQDIAVALAATPAPAARKAAP